LSGQKGAERYDQDRVVHVDAGRLGWLHCAGCPELLGTAVSYTEELAHSWCTDHLGKYSMYCSVCYASFEIFI